MEVGERGLCGVSEVPTFKFPTRAVRSTEVLSSFCWKKGIFGVTG